MSMLPLGSSSCARGSADLNSSFPKALCVQTPLLWQNAFSSCFASLPQELLAVLLECLQLPGPMLRLGIPITPWNKLPPREAEALLHHWSGLT